MEAELARKLNKVIEKEITTPILKLISDLEQSLYPLFHNEMRLEINIFDCKNCEHKKRDENQYPCKNCYCNPDLALKQHYSEAEGAFD